MSIRALAIAVSDVLSISFVVVLVDGASGVNALAAKVLDQRPRAARAATDAGDTDAGDDFTIAVVIDSVVVAVVTGVDGNNARRAALFRRVVITAPPPSPWRPRARDVTFATDSPASAASGVGFMLGSVAWSV